MHLALHRDRDGHAGNVLLLHHWLEVGVHHGFDPQVLLVGADRVDGTEHQQASAEQAQPGWRGVVHD
ncbi:hypothetical protein D3C84_999300 [compost metagenome]